MTAEMIAVITEHHAEFSEALSLVTQRRQPDQIADLEPSSRANELLMQLGYRARLVIPLLASDQIVGALVVRRKGPRGIRERHSRAAADLCGTIGARDPQCPAFQRSRGQEPATGGSEPAQVAVLANMSHECARHEP